MATCKECIHEKVCVVALSQNSLTGIFGARINMENKAEEKCKDFKNKADYSEVIRCEKCEYGKEDDDGMIKCCFSLEVDEETGLECGFASWNDKNFFCGEGKKKEGAENG